VELGNLQGELYPYRPLMASSRAMASPGPRQLHRDRPRPR